MFTFPLLIMFAASTVFSTLPLSFPGQKKLLRILENSKSNSEVDEESPSGRIINGAKAPDGKYHFMASLQIQVKGGWAHYCGGNLYLTFYSFES